MDDDQTFILSDSGYLWSASNLSLNNPPLVTRQVFFHPGVDKRAPESSTRLLDFWPFTQSPSSACHSPAASVPTRQSLFPQEPVPPHPSQQPPKHYSHWTWHRTLQLIQQALHTGTHIFDPTCTISLRLFFCRGCSLPSHRAAALWDDIVRPTHTGQWWASAGFILREGSRKESFRPLSPYIHANHRQEQQIAQKSCGTSIFEDIQNLKCKGLSNLIWLWNFS